MEEELQRILNNEGDVALLSASVECLSSRVC